ncbi:hypothetical protein [Devosia sp.]|uniref:hypothetical protein n=1 Tax=Devosia sp. TaxID=1871048 RepID=UPI003264ADBB
MKHASSAAKTVRRPIPRGWTIVGLAAGAWALVFVVSATASSLFQFVASAV